jgi:hypothetical protein
MYFAASITHRVKSASILNLSILNLGCSRKPRYTKAARYLSGERLSQLVGCLVFYYGDASFPVRLIRLSTLRPSSSKPNFSPNGSFCAEETADADHWSTSLATLKHPRSYPLGPGRSTCPTANSHQGTPVIKSRG